MSVLIVGGGAAGLAAAHFASREGARVTVLEKTSRVGKKILISGGTRCNVLPVAVDPVRDYFTSSSKAALNDVFRSWCLEDCLQWLTAPEDLRLELTLDVSSGKYFPKSNASRDVRDALMHACLQQNVEILYETGVRSVRKCETGWECLTSNRRFRADRVILASGGKSYPKLGTEGTGYGILKRLGHEIETPYPALTPLSGSHPGGTNLAGVSLQSVTVTAKDRNKKHGCSSPRSGFLFTHKGFSGPGILDISHFVTRSKDVSDVEILVDWTSEGETMWEERLCDRSFKGTVVNCIHRFGIPVRLSAALCTAADVPVDRRLADLTKKERQRCIQQLAWYRLEWNGDAGYGLAEVTGGGLPFEEVFADRLESRRCPGIFICGELMDVFGRIGGFNFYWAWLSGRLTGMAAARQSCNKNQSIQK